MCPHCSPPANPQRNYEPSRAEKAAAKAGELSGKAGETPTCHDWHELVSAVPVACAAFTLVLRVRL
jgi:hypothetical protein